MAEQKIYPKGVMVFAPHEKAPKFVKGTIMITLPDLKEWLAGEGKDYIGEYKGKPQLKLQILEFNGKLSVQVDTYGLKKKDDFQVPDSGDSLPF